MANSSLTNLPQTNSQSNQDYDVDISELFEHYVTGGGTPNTNEPGENIGIDDIRAQISASATSATTRTADLIASLNINPNSTNPAPTSNTTTPVLLAQESRCHAFYRILGLPVVSSDASQFYNPGFDITKSYYKQNNLTQNITLSTKITIASNVGSQFEAISAARENWAATTAQIFSVPSSVEAGVLSLTSGTYGSSGVINIRKFNVLEKVSDPFDYNIADQTFSVPTELYLVGNTVELLSFLQNSNADTILSYFNGPAKTPSPAFFSHQHFIAPFNVDPRIDFSIGGSESKTLSGVSRRVAVPFVPDASYLQVSSTANALRPVIELIIRKRVYQANQSTAAGPAIADVQAVITSDPTIGNIPFIGGTPISNIFSSSFFNLSQQNAFADTVSAIQTVMQKLVQALHVVHAAQGIYYWLPIPNTTGPEGGCNIRNVPLNQNFSANLITDEDLNVILNQAQVIFANLNVAATQANAIPDKGGYAFGGQPFMSFNADTTNALGSVSSNTMETLANKRNKKLSDAGSALQTIEMIMGEFSGLGLCDIIAVIGTLYTMDIEDLLGFLDQDAYARAQTLLGSSLPAQNSSITGSMTGLLQGVSGFYQVMDAMYADFIGNNALQTT
jgi:hypothetical protein